MSATLVTDTEEPKAEGPLEPSPAVSAASAVLPETQVCAFDDREICLLGLAAGTEDEI